jgi:hypothetical protein
VQGEHGAIAYGPICLALLIVVAHCDMSKITHNVIVDQQWELARFALVRGLIVDVSNMVQRLLSPWRVPAVQMTISLVLQATDVRADQPLRFRCISSRRIFDLHEQMRDHVVVRFSRLA